MEGEFFLSTLYDFGDDSLSTEKDKVMDAYNKYKDLSHDDLMGELKKITNEKRAEGTWNSGMLEEIANQLRPFLNQEQSERLNKIIEDING